MEEITPGESLPWQQIVSKAVHDMRTPLSCMRTTQEILRMISGDDEEQQKLIGMLDQQVNLLASQMDTLVRTPELIGQFTTPPPLEDGR